MRPRPIGSAGSGFGEWLLQRLTALYLTGFVLWLAWRLTVSPPVGYLAWKQWFGLAGVRLAFALFFLSTLVHAWVGMRSVFLDYARPLWVRALVQMLTIVGLLALGLWAAQILLVEAVA